MSATYFAEDGSYGTADNLTVVDTSEWSDDDWNELEEALEWDRPIVAQRIAERSGR